MRKTVASILAAVALAGGTTVVAAAPAEAAGCATRADFSHIHKGMSRYLVNSWLNSRGRFVDSGYTGVYWELRSYRTCGDDDYITVGFMRGGSWTPNWTVGVRPKWNRL